MDRYYSSTARDTTLTAFISNSATEIQVAGTDGFPQTPFVLVIDPDSLNEEIIDVTNVSGNTLTVTRGVDGSSGLSHNIGAVCRHSVSGRDFTEAMNHRNNQQSVHGVVGAVVGTTDEQALTNKTLGEPNVTGDVTMDGGQIKGLGDPTDDQDAVSKKYAQETFGSGAQKAMEWAIKMDGPVEADEYSSKWHAADADQSATEATEAWSEFASIYLGAHATPPLSNEPGTLYWNTATNKLYVNDGSMWMEVSSADTIKSMDVDQLVVMSWDDWQTFTAHESRTLYVVTADPSLDPDEAYGTFYLGSLQIGGAGKGGILEGSPLPPVNVRWESDDPAVASYRKLMWDDGGSGSAGNTFGYAVVAANEAAKGVTINKPDLMDLEAVITGTEPGVTYEFQVYAANLAGPGERSPSVFREFPGPVAPTNVRSTDDDAFTLTWDHDGQSQIVEDGPVTDYEVDQNVLVRIAATIDVDNKTAELDPDDYVNNQNYKFRVRAKSESGWGEWSEEYVREFLPAGTPYNVRVEGALLLWEYDEVDTGPVTQWGFDQTHPAENSPTDGSSPVPVPDISIGTPEEA